MKSPVPVQGRVGRKEWQDWYRTLVWVANHWSPGDTVLVVTNFVLQGEESEADVYVRELAELGVSEDAIHRVGEGNETITQIKAGLRCRGEDEQMVLVSTWLHAPRVWWLTRTMLVERKMTFGIPRPKEALTDIVLTFLFPIIDLLGRREWFLGRVAERRSKGVL